MAKRFFSADFHLGFSALLDIEKRPFNTVEEMNDALVGSCVRLTREDDIIIHLGDLASFGSDNHLGTKSQGLSVKPYELLKGIRATFLNVRGNHDLRNRVKSACDSMQLRLGKRYPNVTAGHYPSYDVKARDYVRRGWINLCGHVHSKWKHCLDLDRSVLNVNVGVDVWDYMPVSEDELVQYINRLLKHKPDDLFRCKREDGKVSFYEKGEKT